MSWFLIDKTKTEQPASGGYRDWKFILRNEGRKQCVYCAIEEHYFGGYRNYHVEHYKPKSKFPELRDSIHNLFYSCAICNSFKGSDWPGDPDAAFSAACYPNPSAVDYGELIVIDTQTYLLDGKNQAMRYVVERVFLNRPQLVLHRRLIAVKKRMARLLESDVLRGSTGALGAVVALARHTLAESDVAPYEPGEVERR